MPLEKCENLAHFLTQKQHLFRPTHGPGTASTPLDDFASAVGIEKYSWLQCLYHVTQMSMSMNKYLSRAKKELENKPSSL
jgi:hypothetical protein